jgi:hypothetical protein
VNPGSDRRDLEILAARLALGLTDREEIYSFADRATTLGDDNPDLIRIMIEGPGATKEELVPIFVDYLQSCGIKSPSPESARDDLAYRYARCAVDRKISPIDAAHLIERGCVTHTWEDGRLLDFAYCALRADFATTEPNALLIEIECSAEAYDLCVEFVRDFESGNMASWRPDAPKEPRRGFVGFVDRMLEED